MKERIEVIHGSRHGSRLPTILVCPHGADDAHTGHLTKSCAESLQCSAVINWGFERSEDVDVLKDMADCNRIDHIEEDVVREEFLDPLLRLRNRIAFTTPQGQNPNAYIFYIHGFGDQVEQQVGEPLDLILGYGEADIRPSYTCPQWMVDMMIYKWEDEICTNGACYCGKSGGKYSARNINNLCQMFSRHLGDASVRALQIEVCHRLRRNKETAIWTGRVLAGPIENIVREGYFGETGRRRYV